MYFALPFSQSVLLSFGVCALQLEFWYTFHIFNSLLQLRPQKRDLKMTDRFHCFLSGCDALYY